MIDWCFKRFQLYLSLMYITIAVCSRMPLVSQVLTQMFVTQKENDTKKFLTGTRCTFQIHCISVL